ncbi:hypothetical protein C8J56DRAFT_806494, partial [Mycena floridula]
IEDTKPGELRVECPTCPRPGVNLPVGWEMASPERRCEHIDSFPCTFPDNSHS